MTGTVFMTAEFRAYRNRRARGILTKWGRPGDVRHSVAIVAMDRITGCFKIQNNQLNWGLDNEGTAWILFELVYDILALGVTTPHPVAAFDYPTPSFMVTWDGGRRRRSGGRTRRAYAPTGCANRVQDHSVMYHERPRLGSSQLDDRTSRQSLQTGSALVRGNLQHEGKVLATAPGMMTPDTTKFSKSLDLFGFAPPSYLVCSDIMKADLRACKSVLGQSEASCWQKNFSATLVLSSLLPMGLPSGQPFSHGPGARIEYFHSIQGMVEHNRGSYELWLVYINSREQLEDRLIAYDTSLTTLSHNASPDRDAVHSSECILDIFLQMMNTLCISGQVGKALEKLYEIFPSRVNSCELYGPSDVVACLTIWDKCIFWVCCVYLILYKKLPDAVVSQFECQKELSALEWVSTQLKSDEKQQAVSFL